MSTLDFQGVIDPRLDLQNTRQKTYGVLITASDQTYQVFPAQSVNSSNLQFTANPPSDKTYVNKKAYLSMSGTQTFTGTPTSGSTCLLNCSGIEVDSKAVSGSTNGSGEYDASRCLPLSMALTSFQVGIGNNTISQALNQWSRVLQRYQRPLDEENIDLSMSPSMPDQSQQYVDLEGMNLNPLAKYGKNTVQDSRGGFSQVTILDNRPGQTTAQVAFTYTEPFWISPFENGRGQEKLAIIGVQNMNVSCVLGGPGGQLGNALWSHSTSNNGGSSTITSSTVNITNAQVYFNYLTADDTQHIPTPGERTFWSYISPTVYPTTGIAPVAAGASTSINMSSVQLQSIPNRLYIWVDEISQTRTMSSTDTFFRIDSIQIVFDNKSGLLAGASTYDLYQMSVRNGLNYSWNQWNSQIGSVLCVVMGLDLPLKSFQAPGMVGSRTLTMTVNCTNLSNSTKTVQLNVLAMQEGIMSINAGNVSTNLGIINETDVLSVKDGGYISYKNSGNIWGSGFWDDVLGFLKKSAPIAHEVVKSVAPQFSGVSGAVKDALGAGRMKERNFRSLIKS